MAADPSCSNCQGTGWREIERSGLVAVERCACSSAPSAEGIDPVKVGAPPRFREATFESFRCRLPGNPGDYDQLTAASLTVRRYAEEYPLAPKKGLFLQGAPGAGKTHLAVAAMRRLLERGFDVVFFDYQTLIQRIRSSFDFAAGQDDRAAYRRALDADILILDDLGAHRATDFVFDTVTAIISHRYNEDRAVIATTNLPMPEYGDVASRKDPLSGQYKVEDTLRDRIGERAVSRLFEMCTPLRVNVADYRKRRI